MNRRTLLAGVGATLPLLSGCLERESPEATATATATEKAADTRSSTPTGSPTESPTATAKPTETVTATAESSETATPTPAPASVTVEMRSSENVPLRAEIGVGGIVEWVNQDGYGHTVTSDQFDDTAAEWSFEADVAAGETVRRRFEEPGVFEYYCTVHGQRSMCGAVLVGDTTLAADLPCESSGGLY